MSNHDGSYMLNAVLSLLLEYNFFDKLEKQKKYEFLNKIICIGNESDCNDSEIFDELGDVLSFCYYCAKPSDSVDEDGLCPSCLCLDE